MEFAMEFVSKLVDVEIVEKDAEYDLHSSRDPRPATQEYGAADAQ